MCPRKFPIVSSTVSMMCQYGFQRKGKILLRSVSPNFTPICFAKKCEQFAKNNAKIQRKKMQKFCEQMRKFCEKYRIFKNMCKIQTFSKGRKIIYMT